MSDNVGKPDLLSQKVRHRLFPAGLCGMGVGHESVRSKEGETTDVCLEL